MKIAVNRLLQEDTGRTVRKKKNPLEKIQEYSKTIALYRSNAVEKEESVGVRIPGKSVTRSIPCAGTD